MWSRSRLVKHLTRGLVFVLGLVMLLVSSPATGQDDCAGLDAYIQERDDAYRQIIIEWRREFGNRPFLSDMKPDQWQQFIASRTPDELLALSDVILLYQAMYKEMAPPVFAYDYHLVIVDGFGLYANLFREASSAGLIVAALAYADPIERYTDDKDRLGYDAYAVCVDFIQILYRDSVPVDDATVTTVGNDEPVMVSGAEPGISNEFTLEAGRYVARARTEDSGGYAWVSVKLYATEGGRPDYILYGSGEGSGPVPFEEIFFVAESGTYFVEVTGSGAWNLVIEEK
jgi:hypothetical protein